MGSRTAELTGFSAAQVAEAKGEPATNSAAAIRQTRAMIDLHKKDKACPVNSLRRPNRTRCMGDQ